LQERTGFCYLGRVALLHQDLCVSFPRIAAHTHIHVNELLGLSRVRSLRLPAATHHYSSSCNHRHSCLLALLATGTFARVRTDDNRLHPIYPRHEEGGCQVPCIQLVEERDRGRGGETLFQMRPPHTLTLAHISPSAHRLVYTPLVPCVPCQYFHSDHLMAERMCVHCRLFTQSSRRHTHTPT
jgi:hypothetical protein